MVERAHTVVVQLHFGHADRLIITPRNDDHPSTLPRYMNSHTENTHLRKPPKEEGEHEQSNCTLMSGFDIICTALSRGMLAYDIPWSLENKPNPKRGRDPTPVIAVVQCACCTPKKQDYVDVTWCAR